MLIKFIHAKFYANAIAIYNASKMNTHEFNKLLGFEAGAHSPFHTPTGSATWYVIQFRARTAILAAESRTQRMWACPINVRSRLWCIVGVVQTINNSVIWHLTYTSREAHGGSLARRAICLTAHARLGSAKS